MISRSRATAAMQIIEMVTFAVIITMLLLVYRSIITVIIVLVMVVMRLSAARGVVAFLGYHNLIGLSANRDAAPPGHPRDSRGHRLRDLPHRPIPGGPQLGCNEDREQAYYTMFGGTAHVVLGSGMTIAGATFCLHFTRLPISGRSASPMAVGMVVAVFARSRSGRP